MTHRSWHFFVLSSSLLVACGSTQTSNDDPNVVDMTGGTAMHGGSDGSGAGAGGGSDGEAAAGGDKGGASSGTGGSAGGSNANGVGRYTVYEVTLPFSEAGLANVWEDVTASGVFNSPSGKSIAVKGFYHSQDTWKIRFAPSELGTYAYQATIAHGATQKVVDGSFECVSSQEKGFVRSAAQNPRRLVFEDGTLYNALGIGSCDANPHSGDWGLDGGDRSAGEPTGHTDIEGYLQAMAGQAKLNIYRWSVNNCAFDLWSTIAPTGNRYLATEGQWGDFLVQKMREHGLRVYMDIFGWKPMLTDKWQDEASMNAVKRYIDYVVARYGAAVDFWEVCNESSPPTAWITLVANYLKSVDPYRHMISSSWEHPELMAIDVAGPHWYEKEGELASDTRTVEKIQAQRYANKPIIFGEQGNSVQNWDPLSSLRARIRAWTAFFNEGHLIFWESNFAKDYKANAANLYIGPDLRKFFDVLQTFTAAVPADVAIEPVTTAPVGVARAYGLKSPQGIYVYLRDAQGYASTRSGVTLAVNPSRAGVASFYDTTTGAVLKTMNVAAGPSTLTVPDFVADVALTIR